VCKSKPNFTEMHEGEKRKGGFYNNVSAGAAGVTMASFSVIAAAGPSALDPTAVWRYMGATEA
jgi:hypothetical protein